MKIQELNNVKDFEKVKDVFYRTFSSELWFDDWSDKKQLNLYIHDLLDQNNSLSFDLFIEENGNEILVGLALGRVMHFYEGNQFRVDEFCVDVNYQNRGIGSLFMNLLTDKMKELNIAYILLDTVKTFSAYKFYLKNGFEELNDDVGLKKKVI